MHRIKIGIAFSVVIALLAGATFWVLVTKQSSSAEATVTEACKNITATEYFDITMTVDYSDRLNEGDITTITGEISGDKYTRSCWNPAGTLPSLNSECTTRSASCQ